MIFCFNPQTSEQVLPWYFSRGARQSLPVMYQLHQRTSWTDTRVKLQMSYVEGYHWSGTHILLVSLSSQLRKGFVSSDRYKSTNKRFLTASQRALLSYEYEYECVSDLSLWHSSLLPFDSLFFSSLWRRVYSGGTSSSFLNNGKNWECCVQSYIPYNSLLKGHHHCLDCFFLMRIFNNVVISLIKGPQVLKLYWGLP